MCFDLFASVVCLFGSVVFGVVVFVTPGGKEYVCLLGSVVFSGAVFVIPGAKSMFVCLVLWYFLLLFL